jgi:hypothetical protein
VLGILFVGSLVFLFYDGGLDELSAFLAVLSSLTGSSALFPGRIKQLTNQPDSEHYSQDSDQLDEDHLQDLP